MDAANVLILSDTHLADASRLPAAVLAAAERADHIIHAGDHSVLEVVRVLEQFAPVTAVAGNVEDAEVAATLPDRAQVTVVGVTFGVVHDAGTRTGRHARLRSWFPDANAIVYGHSHMPEAEQDDDVWIINPGSPVQRRRAPAHSFAWAGCAAGSVVSAELVWLD